MNLVEKTYDSDVQWVILMNNRHLIREMMSLVEGENVSFGGGCILGDNDGDLSSLIDRETVDLITPNVRVRGKNGSQDVYPTFEEWFTDHAPGTVARAPEAVSPEGDTTTIYFFGDGKGSGEYIDVHWCCAILSGCDRLWFDPSGKFSPNFSMKKIKMIEKVVGGVFTHYDKRMQYFCDPSDLACDIFCQTHVIIFAHCYAKNLLQEVDKIDYSYLQQVPLKKWVKVIRPFLPSWEETFRRPEFRNFWSHVRVKDSEGRVQGLPMR